MSVIHKIVNVSVIHKIVNVSVSHKIVIYRVILSGLDKIGWTMVCNGPNLCLADNMLRKKYQTQLKRGIIKILSILWLTHISSGLTDTCKIYLNCPYFYLSQFENVFGFAL